jgi:hypothetical protein
LDGFHATDVDFSLLKSEGPGPEGVAGKSESETSESFFGASLVPGMSLVPLYADCDAAIVVPTWSE